MSIPTGLPRSSMQWDRPVCCWEFCLQADYDCLFNRFRFGKCRYKRLYTDNLKANGNPVSVKRSHIFVTIIRNRIPVSIIFVFLILLGSVMIKAPQPITLSRLLLNSGRRCVPNELKNTIVKSVLLWGIRRPCNT